MLRSVERCSKHGAARWRPRKRRAGDRPMRAQAAAPRPHLVLCQVLHTHLGQIARGHARRDGRRQPLCARPRGGAGLRLDARHPGGVCAVVAEALRYDADVPEVRWGWECAMA